MQKSAFDEIQHTFMIKRLNKLGIERNFLNTIKAIYEKHKTSYSVMRLKPFP